MCVCVHVCLPVNGVCGATLTLVCVIAMCLPSVMSYSLGTVFILQTCSSSHSVLLMECTITATHPAAFQQEAVSWVCVFAVRSSNWFYYCFILAMINCFPMQSKKLYPKNSRNCSCQHSVTFWFLTLIKHPSGGFYVLQHTSWPKYAVNITADDFFLCCAIHQTDKFRLLRRKPNEPILTALLPLNLSGSNMFLPLLSWKMTE